MEHGSTIARRSAEHRRRSASRSARPTTERPAPPRAGRTAVRSAAPRTRPRRRARPAGGQRRRRGADQRRAAARPVTGPLARSPYGLGRDCPGSARPLALPRASRRPPAPGSRRSRSVPSQLRRRGAGVGRLLRVELGRRQRAVLHRGDEPLTVVGRVTSGGGGGPARRPSRTRTSGRSRTARRRGPRTAPSRPAPSRCSSPCAARPARGQLDHARPLPSPWSTTPCSSPRRRAPACRRRCRAPAGRRPPVPMISGPPTASSPAMQRRSADARHHQAVGGHARWVGGDGDVGAGPLQRALGGAQVARAVVEHAPPAPRSATGALGGRHASTAGRVDRAARSARATALNCASTTWWCGPRPAASTRTCRVIRACGPATPRRAGSAGRRRPARSRRRAARPARPVHARTAGRTGPPRPAPAPRPAARARRRTGGCRPCRPAPRAAPAQRERGVLHRVVRVDLQVAPGAHGQVEPAVLGDWASMWS